MSFEWEIRTFFGWLSLDKVGLALRLVAGCLGQFDALVNCSLLVYVPSSFQILPSMNLWPFYKSRSSSKIVEVIRRW